ncbi:hypothetical protein T01_388 [Trichinella spiralis]|uniref:Uncharacterized protein n=1 Tax=Trichinella spiralis TaxID=6334 RepID=A0A0V1AMA3_TRISP|nr:hypothetical protein T01_388 [Trichinella spiralis]
MSSMYAEVPFLISGSRESTQFSTAFITNADSPHLLRCIQYFISRRCSFMVLKKHSTFSAGDCGFGIQRGLAASSPLYSVLHFSAMFLHGTQEA